MFGLFKQSKANGRDDAPVIMGGAHMPPYCGLSARHSFRTRVVRGLRNDEGAYVVYTPPSYNPMRAEPYPLLVLMHGWTDTEMSWCERGNLNGTMDHWTLDGSIEPAVVVMPLGYGEAGFARAKFSVWQDLPRVRANTDRFLESFETEVMPEVEGNYHVTRERERRTIGGLSMGGLQALVYGLRRPEQFSRIITLSTALDGENLDDLLGSAAALQPGAAERWPLTIDISCGVNDPLVRVNRALGAWCRERGLPTTLRLTTGRHDWMTWRADLAHYLPLLLPGTTPHTAAAAETAATA